MNFRCHMQGRRTGVREIVNWNFMSFGIHADLPTKTCLKVLKKVSDMNMIEQFFAAWHPQLTQEHNDVTLLLYD